MGFAIRAFGVEGGGGVAVGGGADVVKEVRHVRVIGGDEGG